MKNNKGKEYNKMVLSNSQTLKEAKERIPTQREQILNMLREAGELGVTNIELQKVGIGWAGRVRELYQMGYKINNDKCLGNGVYLYILLEEPIHIKSKLKKAKTVLFNRIKEKYKGIVTIDQLDDILEAEDFTIARKPNFFKIN